MEDLFSTELNVNEQNINFQVVFDDGKYLFIPLNKTQDAEEFFLQRNQDKWVADNSLNEEIKMQAIDNLDRYLLKQH